MFEDHRLSYTRMYNQATESQFILIGAEQFVCIYITSVLCIWVVSCIIFSPIFVAHAQTQMYTITLIESNEDELFFAISTNARSALNLCINGVSTYSLERPQIVFSFCARCTAYVWAHFNRFRTSILISLPSIFRPKNSTCTWARTPHALRTPSLSVYEYFYSLFSVRLCSFAPARLHSSVTPKNSQMI